jgi:hypothetical protein
MPASHIAAHLKESTQAPWRLAVSDTTAIAG